MGASMSLPTRVLEGSRRNAAISFVFVTVLLDMLAFGIVIPVLPHLVRQFVGGDVASAALIVGVFGSAFALAQFLASPVQGALSDRFGRRPVILLSNAGLALDFVLMAVANTLPWLFLGRVIAGITAASVSTANAYIADVTAPERRAGAFGLLGAAFGIGFVLGPAFGGWLGSIDLRLPFWVAAGLAAANVCWGLFVLPESLPPERRAPFRWRNASPVGAWQLVRAHPGVIGLVAAVVLSQFAHYALPRTFVLYALHRYGWDAQQVGSVLALVGIGNALVQGLLVRVLVPRVGEGRALLAGLMTGALGFALMGMAGTGSVFLAAIPLLSLWGLTGPSAQALMTRRVGAAEQGRLQGAVTSFASATGIVAPFLFATAFAAGVRDGARAELPGIAFLAAALLLSIGAVIGWRAAREPSGPKAQSP
jgi:DHA1 family tetracycline resistance protein-like MFS transporter